MLGLEINERPLKRPLLDFENLSISDSAEKGILLIYHSHVLSELISISCLGEWKLVFAKCNAMQCNVIVKLSAFEGL